MASSALPWLLAGSICLSTGCIGAAGLQDWNYNRVNRSRAATCWKSSFDREKRNELGRDFELGFKSGYFDLATGRDCRVPPVAPPKYWSANYQTCDAQACVQAWFRGYQSGVTAAQKCGLDSFNSVPVSACAPTVNCSGDGACYSADECSSADGECCPEPGVQFSPGDYVPGHALESTLSSVEPSMMIGPIDLPVSRVMPAAGQTE